MKNIALTDHENIDGIPEAVKAGKKVGVRLVSAGSAEFGAHYEGKTEHILGYFMDLESPELNSYLDFHKKRKITNVRKAADFLREYGFKISVGEILSLSRGAVEDFHLWAAVSENPANLPILEKWEVENSKQFYQTFLRENSITTRKKKLPLKKMIEIIKKADGIAVWAHPLWKEDEIPEIKRKAEIFYKLGLDGIETCYSRHSMEKTLALHEIAGELLMFETIGSDFHSFKRKGEERRMGGVLTYGLELYLPYKLF